MQLEIKNLTKAYSSKKFGLKDFSINITSGVLGLLGPNGAGKSTLMKIISSISKPTSGKILLNGNDIVKNPNDIRKILGYLPQDFGVYPNLNAYEFLTYIAAMKGVGGKGLKNRIEELIEGVNLTEVAKNYLGTYSGGMIQRIGIAQALLNNPKILIFDEPTVGLDPEERLRFRDLLADLAENRIVILSSHIVSDIETIADEIAIMKKGMLITKGNHENSIKFVEGKVFETFVDKDAVNRIKTNHTIISSYRLQDKFKIRYITDISPYKDSQPVMATLEDAYIYFVKK